jgi:hypothetical protein
MRDDLAEAPGVGLTRCRQRSDVQVGGLVRRSERRHDPLRCGGRFPRDRDCADCGHAGAVDAACSHRLGPDLRAGSRGDQRDNDCAAGEYPHEARHDGPPMFRCPWALRMVAIYQHVCGGTATEQRQPGQRKRRQPSRGVQHVRQRLAAECDGGVVGAVAWPRAPRSSLTAGGVTQAVAAAAQRARLGTIYAHGGRAAA